MTLNAGTVTVTLQFASGLENKNWVARQDPYAILQCGNLTFRSKTAKDGGTSPVWNETFNFEVLDENAITITIKDSEIIHDESLGRGEISLRNVRERGQEDQVVQLYSRNNEQRGQVNVQLQYRPNNAAQPYPGQYPPQQAGGYPQQPGGYAAPPYGGPGYGGQQQYGDPGYGAIDELRREEQELRQEINELRQEEMREEREEMREGFY